MTKTSPEPLDAGEFMTWLAGMRASLHEGQDSDVPCGSCTACCTSLQFIHVGPDEVDALAHIPAALLFAAPRMPAGHMLMGFTKQGHCPMLMNGACSIYSHRPRTCRTYDCRVFPAAGLMPDEPTKALIAERAVRWEFSHADVDSRTQHDAVRAAALFLIEHPEVFPDGHAPPETQTAVMALELHSQFIERNAVSGSLRSICPGPEEIQVELRRRHSGHRVDGT
jgi:uncharacterized protein